MMMAAMMPWLDCMLITAVAKTTTTQAMESCCMSDKIRLKFDSICSYLMFSTSRSSTICVMRLSTRYSILRALISSGLEMISMILEVVKPSMSDLFSKLLIFCLERLSANTAKMMEASKIVTPAQMLIRPIIRMVSMLTARLINARTDSPPKKDLISGMVAIRSKYSPGSRRRNFDISAKQMD